MSHGARGHRGYLFGETGLGGWWYFYPVALALKTTLGAQALAVLLVVAWLRRRPRGTDLLIDAALWAYPVLLLVVMSLGRTQLGLRYILPAYPFAMLWAGRTFPSLRALGGRWGLAAGAIALVASTAGALRVHPHYLMFFNSWIGGPERGPQYLVIGDSIGQDQRRLADWQAEQGLSSIYYTRYSGRPEYWGVAYSAPPCQPQSGVYALDAIEVHRPRRIEAGCLDWLTVEPPDERIGYSIYIYRVDRERAQRLRQDTSRVPILEKEIERPRSTDSAGTRVTASDGRRPSGVALDAPGARTKDQLGLVLIVAPAAKRDVLGGRGTSQRVGPDVMELQEGALGASASILADEGALASIVPPCRSLDLARRVTRGEPAV